jgi:hypothetical protein
MRYYFDLDDDLVATRDAEGHEFSERDAMRDEAIRVLPDLAQDELPNGDRRVFTVKVRDESGKYVFQATLSLIVTWLG